MENKNKNLWIWIVVIVIVLIGVVVWATKSSAPTVTNNNNTPVVDNTNALQVQSTEDLSIGSVNAGNVNTGAPAASLSYAQALVTYKDARLQLDAVCQASPDNMTFKNNALLMIDNRAPVARNVHIGSIFPIKAYGFKIVKLSSTTLPVTWKVDCDSSQNVASILIQK